MNESEENKAIAYDRYTQLYELAKQRGAVYMNVNVETLGDAILLFPDGTNHALTYRNGEWQEVSNRR